MARILVIEDDEIFRNMLIEALEEAGHEALPASDGREGVRRFRQEPADLVLTDIIMPDQEGLETIVELRRDWPGLKIVVMSGGGAVGAETYLKLARKLGADQTLAKPFSVADLYQTIDDLLLAGA